MSAIAVVPIKDLHQVKSRLRGVFTGDFVNMLILSMAQRVIIGLDDASLFEKIIVISPDEKILQYPWTGHCTRVKQDGYGLNVAIQQICNAQAFLHYQDICIIHADLPLISSQAINQTFDAMMQSSTEKLAIIVPDRHAKGTTGLWLRPPQALLPEFGIDSFSRHLAQARRRHIAGNIIRRPELMFDLDTRSDIADMQTFFPEIWHDMLEDMAFSIQTID